MRSLPFFSFLILCSSWAPLLSCVAQGLPARSPADNAPAPPAKVEILVSPSVRSNNNGYYKIQKLSLTVSLKNTDLRNPAGPLTVSYWILGKCTNNGKQFCLLKKGSFACSLDSSPSSREFKQTTDPYLNKFWADDFGSSGYTEYEGWIVVVKNSANQVIATKANKTEWDREFEKAALMERGKVYDFHLDKLDGLSVYYTTN